MVLQLYFCVLVMQKNNRFVSSDVKKIHILKVTQRQADKMNCSLKHFWIKVLKLSFTENSMCVYRILYVSKLKACKNNLVNLNVNTKECLWVWKFYVLWILTEEDLFSERVVNDTVNLIVEPESRWLCLIISFVRLSIRFWNPGSQNPLIHSPAICQHVWNKTITLINYCLVFIAVINNNVILVILNI